MKNVFYQVVQFSFQKDDVSFCFFEVFQLINEKPLDNEALIAKLELKVKQSEEKEAIDIVLERYENDDVQMDTLDVLVDVDFEVAILRKHKAISQIDQKSVTLLNKVTSTVEDKELLSKRYTSEIVSYFKEHHDEYPSLNVNALSKLRNFAVKRMLLGYDIEDALDQAYDEVMDS